MLRLLPLGGLGEIGLNAMVFEHGDDRLLVDAGLMFPTEDMPGVEVVVPDFAYLRDDPRKLKGVVLTHGHEDHLGALPYLLRDVNVPVWGSPYALGLLELKLDELEIEADLRVIGPRERVRVGEAFEVEAIQVAHSTPLSYGFAVDSPSGRVIHTGDFKLDPHPTDGRGTDLDRLGELGEQGVDVLLSDSTNSQVAHETGSEQTVKEAFERLIPEAKGRVIVALFGSNLHRVKHIAETAAKCGRKVIVNGRSLMKNIELGIRLGLFDVPEGTIAPFEQATSLPPERTVMLATGAQGEPRSALPQMVTDDGRELTVRPGDTVIFSSRTIPGNERAVSALVDALHHRGAIVVTPAEEPCVHVSGHASPGQQRKVLELTRPRNFVPVHGELRHLYAHLETARAQGLSVDHAFLLRDGEMLGFREGRGQRLGNAPAGRFHRDRFGTSHVLEEALRERQWLAEAGAVAVTVVLDSGTRAVKTAPVLAGRGLGVEESAALEQIGPEVRAAFEEISPALRGDDAFVREELTRAVRRAFKTRGFKRPTVLPQLVKL